jgi:hypothetical protein
MRRSTGKRAKRRRFDATLKRILALEREGHSPRAISDSLQVDSLFVETILDDFYRWREARGADEGGGA